VNRRAFPRSRPEWGLDYRHVFPGPSRRERTALHDHYAKINVSISSIAFMGIDTISTADKAAEVGREQVNHVA
jgi:hypothetical protein